LDLRWRGEAMGEGGNNMQWKVRDGTSTDQSVKRGQQREEKLFWGQTQDNELDSRVAGKEKSTTGRSGQTKRRKKISSWGVAWDGAEKMYGISGEGKGLPSKRQKLQETIPGSKERRGGGTGQRSEKKKKQRRGMRWLYTTKGHLTLHWEGLKQHPFGGERQGNGKVRGMWL